MFWKKKEGKKLSPKETMINQIEQLGPEQSLSYRLAELYGSDLAVVELNPQYPGKGKKYSLSTEKLVQGKPAGKRSHVLDADNPKGIVSWILDRKGVLVS